MPSWLFECRESRLIRFHSEESVAMARAEALWTDRIKTSESTIEQAVARLAAVRQHTASSCFSDEFRKAAAALAALGEEELEAKRHDNAALKQQQAHAIAA